MRCISESGSAVECACESRLINIFQLGTHGYTVCNPGDLDIKRIEQLVNIIGRGLTLGIRIQGQDYFLDILVIGLNTGDKLLDPDIIWTYIFER